MRVLFIDDLIEELNAFKELLELDGIDVIGATDVDSGYDMVQAGGFDVVIVDIMMPPGRYRDRQDNEKGMRTGIYLIQDIRASFPRLPIIALTNVSMSGVLEPLYGCPFIRIVQKTEVSASLDALPKLVRRSAAG